MKKILSVLLVIVVLLSSTMTIVAQEDEICVTFESKQDVVDFIKGNNFQISSNILNESSFLDEFTVELVESKKIKNHNKNNNQINSEIIPYVVPGPDLDIYNLNPYTADYPYPYEIGQNAQFYFTIANISEYNVNGDIVIGIFIEDTILGTVTVPALNAWTASSYILTIPSTVIVPEGFNTITLEADYGNYIYEQDETNNVEAKDFEWVGGYYNIQGLELTTDQTSYVVGEDIDFNFLVRNDGPKVIDSFTVGVYVNNDLVGSFTYGQMLAFNSGIIHFTLNIPTEGEYLIEAVVDPFNTIDEGQYEGDNTASKTINVGIGYGNMGWDYMYTDTDNRYISSGYKLPDRPSHCGIDIVSSTSDPILGDEIKNVYAGNVIVSQWSDSSGYFVVVQTDSIDPVTGNKLNARYLHMRDLPSVNINTYIPKGEKIGFTGDTGWSDGPHLHFDVNNMNLHSYIDSNPTAAVNPQKFFPTIVFSGKTSDLD